MDDHDYDGHCGSYSALALAVIALSYAVIVVAVLYAGWIFVGPARAHEAPSGWVYPAVCCSNRDCNMVKADRVKEGPDGYEVTLLPGDHDFVKTKPVSYVIPYDKVKDSPDGAYHICINPALTMLCFFAGARMG